MRVTERAHRVVRSVVMPDETVVDATAGNGHDTLFLATCVGPAGRVYGFDVQQEAIDATRKILLEAGIGSELVHLLLTGHERMEEAVEGPVAVVMFNLGYLPGGDHTFTTRTASTLQALEQAWDLLRAGGVITVVCYRGHPGGAEEAGAVCEWARELKNAEVSLLGREETATGPFVVVVQKVLSGPDSRSSQPTIFA